MKQLSDNALRQLKPRERAFLALEALSRGDEAEVERLRDTCPQETYRWRQWDYADLINRMTVTVFALESTGRGQIIDLLTACTPDANPQGYLDMVGIIKGHVAGWKAFCDECGLSHDLYRAVAGEPSLWLAFADTLAEIEVAPNPVAQASTLANLRQTYPQ